MVQTHSQILWSLRGSWFGKGSYHQGPRECLGITSSLLVEPRFLQNGFHASSIVKKVGDRSFILFWLDNWVGKSRLCGLFPRPLSLEKDKEAKVKDSVCWVYERWDCVWD